MKRLALDLVTDSIVHNNQKGFIRGRKTADMLREIDDILESGKEREENLIMLSLDFKKVCDAISMTYIQDSITRFGLGNIL